MLKINGGYKNEKVVCVPFKKHCCKPVMFYLHYLAYILCFILLLAINRGYKR